MKALTRRLLLLPAWIGLGLLAMPLGAVENQVPVQTVQEQVEHPSFCTGQPLPWSRLTMAQLEQDLQEAVRRFRAKVAEIRTVQPENANFENVLLALEEASDELDCVMMVVRHISYVADSEEVRRMSEKVMDITTEEMTAVFDDETIWHLVKTVNQPEKLQHLGPAQRRASRQWYDIFVDNGANLSVADKQKRVRLAKELAQLAIQYDANMLDVQQSWELFITDIEALSGVPSAAMDMMERAAREKGLVTGAKPGWLITLRDETAGTVLATCDVESTRKQCWEAACGLGKGTPSDNEPVVHAIMQKRQELAELLGFANYADYLARTRMVRSGAEAMAFVDSLYGKVRPYYEQELARVLSIYQGFKQEAKPRLEPWDELYAQCIYCSVSCPQQVVSLKPYFRNTDVINGLLYLYSEMLGVSFKQLPAVCLKPGESCPAGKVEVWHPSVLCLEVTDKASGTRLGIIYLDLYRRADKRSGAWCAPIQFAAPGPRGEILRPHVSALLTNFAPPIKGKPTLWEHNDVVVLFHEFGHLIYNVVCHTEVGGHCAAGVAWDFSEFTSTLSENFAWSPDVLALFAKHYKTGKPCPRKLLEAVCADRKRAAALTYMQVLARAKVDLEMHMNYEQKFRGRSLDEAEEEVLRGWRMELNSVPYSLMREMPHCCSGGYAAGVYTYLWSEVMAADAFTRFQEAGVLDEQVGAGYRKSIINTGDSIPAYDAYKLFMGRAPKLEPFLKMNDFVSPQQ